MVFAFGSGQRAFNVVKAADQTGTQVHRSGRKGFPWSTPSPGGVEARPEQVIDEGLEPDLPLALLLLHARRDVIIQRQRGSHDLMLFE